MARVSIVRTTGDEYADIKAAVDQVIDQLGGLADIIKPGYRVIIKLNLVAALADRLSGGATRWEVCKAIFEAVKAVGAEPVIAESAAAGADTEKVIEKCGYQELRNQGLPGSYNLIFGDKACTGCRNTVLSCLMDMKDQDLFSYLENMNVIVGPCTEEDLPEGASPENTVCVGICTKKLADAFGFRHVAGCPPGNVDTVKGILGSRREYGVRYE